MSDNNDKFTIRNGRILIYQREGCGGSFQCRIRFQGKRGYVRKSLWTKDKQEAIEQAEQIFDDLNYKVKRGLSISGKKFNRVCDEYLSQLKEHVRIGKAKQKKLKDYSLICERYLKNYFGKKDIDKIGDSEIVKYRDWRNAYWITGEGAKVQFIEYEREGKMVKTTARHKTPSLSTINSEETVLRQIFEYAIKKQYISRGEIPDIKSERVKSNRRPAFSLEEYRVLRAKSYWRCKKAPNENTQRQRLLLHDFILIMTNAGTRPIEAMTLRWRDIRTHVSPESGERHIVLSVRGKSKRRDLVAQPSAAGYLKRVRKRQEEYAVEHGFKISKEDYVFSGELNNPTKSFKAGFNALLVDADLVTDNHGLKRTIYSMRHTYATFRKIYGNVDVFDLANNMGTSVEMIKKHYYHGENIHIADRLTKMIRRKSKDAIVEE